MKRNLPTRIALTVLILLLALSVSVWTGNAAPFQPVPTGGTWTGITNLNQPVSFTVSPSGTQWSNFSLKFAYVIVSPGLCFGILTQTVPGPGNIVANQFTVSVSTTFVALVQFTSPTTATGSFTFTNVSVPFCGSFSGSGTFTAQTGAGSTPTPTVPPGSTFADVPTTYWAHDFIERLYNAGITGGCSTSPLNYCPEQTVTRAQMAVFLLRGRHGSSYAPPPVGATTGFGDVPTDYWSATFIKQLAAEGITTGCGNGNYCPEHPVTRAQMAVFLLRSEHGAAYTPPGVGAGTGFGDVPPDYWSAAWIKQLVAEAITSGCGSGNYCPEDPVTRAQMAVFLVRTFNLP
jgi:hypothetical protein